MGKDIDIFVPSERRSEKVVIRNKSGHKTEPCGTPEVHGLNVNFLHSQEHAVFSHLGNCTAMTKAVGGCQYQPAYPLAYDGERCQRLSGSQEHAHHIFLLINKAVPFMSDKKEL